MWLVRLTLFCLKSFGYLSWGNVKETILTILDPKDLTSKVTGLNQKELVESRRRDIQECDSCKYISHAHALFAAWPVELVFWDLGGIGLNWFDWLD